MATVEQMALPAGSVDPGAVLHLVTKALELAKLNFGADDSIIALLSLAKTLAADRVVASARRTRGRL